MKGNTYITGFMGAGKTAVGKSLAVVLRRPFVDMDALITRKTGVSVESFFKDLGEDRFRIAETEVLQKLGKQEGLVIATGGGTPEKSQNRELMRKSGTIVYLQATLDDCLTRIRKDTRTSRPLFTSLHALQTLYAKRAGAYADHDFMVDVSGKTAEEAAAEICAKILPETSAELVLGQHSHKLYITRCAPEKLSEFIKPEKTFVIMDHNVQRLLGPRFHRALNGCTVMSLRPGERSKTLRSAQRLYEAMLKQNLGRDGLVVAIGGGVITDLGGYVASTYKRGLPFVLVSTSLVGCVDAAVGGKTAVNFGNVKNAVGCFATPTAVLLDLGALNSLPRSNIVDGLVEAYKTALVAKPELALFIQDKLRHLMKGDLISLKEVIRLSVEAKSEVVQRDFRETGIRKILNFGHTFGHAVESFNGYRVRHGTAVALGMMAAVSISQKRGLLNADAGTAIRSTLINFFAGGVGLPGPDEAWRIMVNDKKNSDGRITFVLLVDYGLPLITQDVSRQELREALLEVEELM